MQRFFSVYAKSLLALYVVSIAGCSSAPSAGDGERLLREKIKNESQGRIELVSFSKTNGQQANLGVPVYKMDYEAEIEFLEDCYWGDFNQLFGWNGKFNTSKEHYLYDTTRQANKGSRTKVKGSITFEKTEAGWRGEDGKIY